MARRLRVIPYARVSTDEQAEFGTGLDEQKGACQKLADLVSAEVVFAAADPGISGTVYPRPGLEQALTALEEGRADALIAYNVSRLGRRASICLAIWERIQAAGARLFLVDGGEVTEDNELLFTVQGGFAQHEWREIVKRMKSGFRRRAEQGIQPCRNLSPYGYHIVTKADVLRGEFQPDQLGRYQIVEEEASWVREIFRRYAAGASMRDVIRFLHERGAPTKHGKNAWYRCTVQAILTNPVYKGAPTFGRRQSRTDKSRLSRGLKHATYVVPALPENIVTLSAPALVSEGKWDVCQQRRDQNKEKLSGNPERRYMLSGLLRCPVCGRAMTGKGNNQKDKRYYLCRQANSTGEPGLNTYCVRKHYQIDKTEHTILSAILELARRPEMIEAAVAAYNRRETFEDWASRRTQIENELTQLDLREQATARAQIEAMMQGRSTEVYDRLLAETSEKRTSLSEQLAVVRQKEQRQGLLEPKTVAQKYAESIKSVEAALLSDEIRPAEKHAILSTVIRSITPEAEGFRIQTVYNTSP